MDSKSILMISYYFPPEGNAAVYRSMRFLKELVKARWQATMVCCQPYQYERYDPQLLDQVPPTTRVIRIKARDPWRAIQTWRGVRTENKLASSSVQEARQVVAGHHAPWRSSLRELVRRAEAWVYRPDMAMLWIRPTTQETIAFCRQSEPSVIWATIGPLSAGVVAYRTSEATGIPYMLDFRDPWGLEYYGREARRPAWAKKVDNRIIARMFERARAVVFMFESVAQAYLRAYPQSLERTKIHIIPNGFEGEVESFVHAPGERCLVLYAGTLSSYRYDTLLEGIVQFKRKDPTRATQLRLLFIGGGLREFAERVRDLEIEDVVKILPPTSSAEIRRLQREAHALLVLGRESGVKGHELVAGAKLFGYLQAGRPIVGVLPHDETRRILCEVGNTLIADASNPEEVTAVFEKVVEAWASRTLDRFVPNRAACEAYSSGRQISNLIAALNGASPEKIVTVDASNMPLRLQSEVAP
ncbi:MAG: glycosyltransferase [Nitrospira sp.]